MSEPGLDVLPNLVMIVDEQFCSHIREYACYGGQGKVHVLKNEDGTRHFIKLRLKPGQFVILTN